jgi:hypothetical protein
MRIKKLREIAFTVLFVIAGPILNPAQWSSPAKRYGVRIEHVWIPMKDSVRLAANLFMPTGADSSEKFPVLLEYLPYRKDDGTATRDYAIQSYFVRSGYVGARVDIRGTGQSEGPNARPGVFRARAARWNGDHRVAGEAALVQWQRRDVRHFVEWVQFSAACHATPTRVESNYLDMLNGATVS